MYRSYHYISLRLWNNLPDYVRRAPSRHIFKSILDEVNLTTRVEWNNDVKMPLVKLSDINWQIVFMGLQKETGTSKHRRFQI